MHNLGVVIGFEFFRTIRKKTFWLSVLALPVVGGVFVAIVYFSNTTADQLTKTGAEANFSIQITDDSGLLQPSAISSVQAQVIESKEAGINAVKSGTIDAYFYYPRDLTKDSVEVFGQEVGILKNNRYATVANELMKQSLTMSVEPNVTIVLSGGSRVNTTTFQNGNPYDPIGYMIAPGFFLVLFYIVIVMFGNQMLTSTTEEKENRVIEMLLTSVSPKTLIIGKIVAVIAIGLSQVAILALLAMIAYAITQRGSLPNLGSLSLIVFDPWRIGVGFTLFMLSFLFFTGLLVTIGAAVPTAKEAGGFMTVILLIIFSPIYLTPLFISSPDAIIVQFLSYFPLTAPIPLLMRNAIGNLGVIEIIVASIILLVSTNIVLYLAVHTFRYGSLEYSRRLSIKEIIRRI